MRIVLILSLAAMSACGPPRVQGTGFGDVGATGTAAAGEPTTEELAAMAQAQAAE